MVADFPSRARAFLGRRLRGLSPGALGQPAQGSPPNPAVHQELKTAFDRKYEAHSSDWSGHSGSGSGPFATLPYRSFLESFIRLNDVSSIVDIGCGDWQFSRFIDFAGVDYLGLDVVDKIVKANQEKYGSTTVRFQSMPEDYLTIPRADLLIVKDVLQHLPDADIFRMARDVFPKFKNCLITNSYLKLETLRNVDIPAGDFRCLDLTAAPFFFRGSYVLEFSSPLWENIRTLLHQPVA